MRKDGRKTEKEAKSFALPTWAPVLLLTRDDTAVSDERIWIDRLVHRISTAALELWIFAVHGVRVNPLVKSARSSIWPMDRSGSILKEKGSKDHEPIDLWCP